jgi:hypothetical protein
MFRTKPATRAAARTVVAVAAAVLVATPTGLATHAASPTTAKAIATVSAAEYRLVEKGMTKAEVHDVVGGVPKSVQTRGKRTVETFRGWDRGGHARVRVTYRTTDGQAVVTAKTTQAAGGSGGGGGNVSRH